MKQRKIFLGISIPSDRAKCLERKMEPFQQLPIRFVKKDNFHVTLLFLGHITDEAVADTCFRVQKACENIEPFDIEFQEIALAPEQGKDAKTLWLTGEANTELLALREIMEKALNMFVTEKKHFSPHITLGRVRQTQWQKLETFPVIQEKLIFSIPVESVTVFESVFEKGRGLVYESLGDYPLEGY